MLDFQLIALAVRHLLMTFTVSAPQTTVWAVERSPFSDELFFDLNASEQTSPAEREYYHRLARIVQTKYKKYGFIFLPAKPLAKLLEGIRKRNRPGEEKIDLEYLRRLETAYTGLQEKMRPLQI